MKKGLLIKLQKDEDTAGRQKPETELCSENYVLHLPWHSLDGDIGEGNSKQVQNNPDHPKWLQPHSSSIPFPQNDRELILW